MEAAAGYAELVRRDDEALRPVREHARAGGLFYRQVPELPEDVHDLESLDRVARYVFERD